MAKVFRIFVEKKRGNDIEAGQTLADLRDNVGLNALDDLRISTVTMHRALPKKNLILR